MKGLLEFVKIGLSIGGFVIGGELPMPWSYGRVCFHNVDTNFRWYSIHHGEFYEQFKKTTSFELTERFFLSVLSFVSNHLKFSCLLGFYIFIQEYIFYHEFVYNINLTPYIFNKRFLFIRWNERNSSCEVNTVKRFLQW